MRPVCTALLVSIVASIGAGCSGGDAGDQAAIPDSLLVDVLVEVYSATARAHLDGTDPAAARAEAVERFGLDTMTLNRTLEYFSEHPDSASTIYQRALDSLIVIERNLRAQPELDSLRRFVRG